MKKIGIYGGTFDPVHHAHLILARDALETLGLDEIIFVPASISPLKKTAPVASGELRLAMLRAAIKGEPKFVVDDCELNFVILDRKGQPPTSSYPVIDRKIDISATEIRTRVASGRSIRYLVPPAVEEIIRREKLYLEQPK